MGDVDGFDLVPAHLAVQAMRDNGYRNAAYAAAELIDNSIQAGATVVELLVREETELVQARRRSRIREIAVLDNGIGMDSATLRRALQFGNGTHLDDRSGIGRFGMGLPSASISQCQRVDVWSWQDGIENAIHTHIDLGLVAKRVMREVPDPGSRDIPEFWLQSGLAFGASGTLVVWSDLDRIVWRTGKAVMENSEFLVARMYRQFLDRGEVKIRMATYEGAESAPKHEWFAVANDPGYLIEPSSTPAPYDRESLFQRDGESWMVRHSVCFGGEEHEVQLRFSYAREEARNVRNAGSSDYGKHAAKNIGVSLVRAGRELDMDQAFVSTSEARDRWWGVEVDFPPALDELFGVTNNKQSARNFSDLASRLESLKGSPDWNEFLKELSDEADPRAPLLEILDLIDRRVRALRNLIQLQKAGADRARRRHEAGSAEAAATAATRERQGQGQIGQSDAEESLPQDERQHLVEEALVESGLSPSDAQEMAAKTIGHGLKYIFTEAALEGTAFFSVAPKAGEILIKVNTNHPAYGNLLEVLETDPPEGVSVDELKNRLVRAGRGLKLLLMAWARYEDEQPSDQLRAETQDARAAWGQMAYRFLQDR